MLFCVLIHFLSTAVKKHYDITLERVRDYYGIVTHVQELKEIINILERIRRGRIGYDAPYGHICKFLEKHNLIDKSKYHGVIAQKSIGLGDS